MRSKCRVASWALLLGAACSSGSCQAYVSFVSRRPAAASGSIARPPGGRRGSQLSFWSDSSRTIHSRRSRRSASLPRWNALPAHLLTDFAVPLAHGWDALSHALASSTTTTASSAAISISNPPSWTNLLPSVPSIQQMPHVNSLPVPVESAKDATVNALGHDVLTFLAASVVVVPLSRFLGVTPVLTFLVAGCLLGPYGLGVFSNTEADLELGDFGILFLLFSEGLNLSPERLRNLGAFYGLGILQIVASMGLFFVGILVGGPLVLQYVAPVIHMDDYVYQIFSSPAQAFCIASAGALSSSAFVLPVLKAKEWEDRPEGIAALSVLLLQDLAVAPLLVLLPLVAGSGPQSSVAFGILAAKATVGFGAVLALGSVLLRYVFDIVAAARSTETFVAAALLVALGMGQAADALGLSATTGAFAAGVLLAGNRYRAQIKADVRPFEGASTSSRKSWAVDTLSSACPPLPVHDKIV
jgi:Kef-type K+ transport system membrane component KefB